MGPSCGLSTTWADVGLCQRGPTGLLGSPLEQDGTPRNTPAPSSLRALSPILAPWGEGGVAKPHGREESSPSLPGKECSGSQVLLGPGAAPCFLAMRNRARSAPLPSSSPLPHPEARVGGQLAGGR